MCVRDVLCVVCVYVCVCMCVCDVCVCVCVCGVCAWCVCVCVRVCVQFIHASMSSRVHQITSQNIVIVRRFFAINL